ncbi:uncharacterized protein LOC133038440 [Cannabis sativa]|uniref:uncharacterized protein LOC133038440 n=1 Tax=Cannabis sativa TaxID=3483 RepID=UPI0029C9D49F|nr:uncharacterized protein LOC133038440 [Cannabis sativa]
MRVDLKEQLPTNIDNHKADIAFDHSDELDALFHNNDPMVDLGRNDDVAIEVKGFSEHVFNVVRMPVSSVFFLSRRYISASSREIYLGKLYKNKEEMKNVVGRGKKKGRYDMFEVTVFHNKHTCNLNSRNSYHCTQAAPWVIGYIIKNKYTLDRTNYKEKDIQRDIFDEYGIKMSYKKAWRCREKAVMYVKGTPAESYTKLYGYLYMLEQKNLGTITDINMLEDKVWGTMLVAIAYDANNQLFPVAFVIINSENHNSWKYFLRKLKGAIGEVETLIFISNRHQSIEHALEVVFPEACHCACFKHIIMNVVHKFKTDVCNKQIWLVAYAWNKTECDRHFEVLKWMDLAFATYLKQIGFSLQNWFVDRLEKASKCTTPLATTFKDDLIAQHKDGRFRSVLHNGEQLFNIGMGPEGERGGDVDLVERTCTYGLF